jgi:hypothetical protein
MNYLRYIFPLFLLGIALTGICFSQEWRINCGGLDYVTLAGELYEADRAYVPGDFGYVGGTPRTYLNEVIGTLDDPLYQSIRFNVNPFGYIFDNIPSADYTIIIHFVEPVDSVIGGRLINVAVEGELLIENLDVFAESGGLWTAHTETLYVDITDGQLNLDVTQGEGSAAIICAISVFDGPPPGVMTFQNVADAVGLLPSHDLDGTCSPQLGSGSAWADYDNDGDLDIYVTNNGGASRLYRNQGDTDGDGIPDFIDFASLAGVRDPNGISHSAVFIDYDNDGDQDLFKTNQGGNVLYQNRLIDGGGATFLDVTTTSGLRDDGRTITSAWADYNMDGFLDVYLAKHFNCLPSDTSTQDRLYVNNGDGTFSDNSVFLCPAGIPPCPQVDSRLGSTAGWFDFDNDGDLDLYLVSDVLDGSWAGNVLWRNDGPDGYGGWIFTDISTEAGVDQAVSGMGLGIGDYDNDGYLDLAFSNVGANVLLHNNGDGTFSNVTAVAGVARDTTPAGDQSVTWGTNFFDHDNDGNLDLFFVAGNVDDVPIDQPDAFFRNNGDGTFTDLSISSGLGDPSRGRNASTADLDFDGFVDVFVGNYGEAPKLYRNNSSFYGNPNHWLQVTVQGSRSNRDGIGTRITATTPDGVSQIREITSGPTHGGGDYRAAYFGLDSNTTCDLTIRLPMGDTLVMAGVAADQVLHVIESATSVDDHDQITNRFELFSNFPNPFNPSTTIRYSLGRETEVSLKVYTLLGQEVRTLVNSVQAAGQKAVEWDGRNEKGNPVASGIYIYRMKAGDFMWSSRMILLK